MDWALWPIPSESISEENIVFQKVQTALLEVIDFLNVISWKNNLFLDVEDMAEILLAKADQVDITAGCEDCGGCSKSSKYKTTPEKELKTVA